VEVETVAVAERQATNSTVRRFAHG